MPPPFGHASAPRRPDPPADTAANGYSLEKSENGVSMRPPTGQPEPATERRLFGGLDDDRFPSPRKLRRTLAYLLDVVVHTSVGLGMYFVASPATQHAVLHQEWDALHINWFTVACYALLTSFIDRVPIQAIAHTTIGKAVFGLVIIDRDTGRYPRLRWLLASWLVSVFMAIQLPFALLALDAVGPSRPERYMLPAVRRSDMKTATANPPGDAAPAARAPMDIPVVDFGRSLSADECHSIVRDGIIDNSGR